MVIEVEKFLAFVNQEVGYEKYDLVEGLLQKVCKSRKTRR
jgi:hypothetical protein